MNNMKNIMRHTASLLVMALIVSMMTPITKANAEVTSITIDMEDNSYMQIDVSDKQRVAKYYVDDRIVQKAVYNLVTGDISSYEFVNGSEINSENGTEIFSLFDCDEKVIIKTYHISEFVEYRDTDVDACVISPDINFDRDDNASGNYYGTLLRTNEFTSGETYKHSLYGKTAERVEQEKSWHFAVGTLVAIVAVVLSICFAGFIGIVISIISTGVGLLLSEFSGEEWVKVYYWIYTFVQSLPTTEIFECQGDFIYKKEKVVSISIDDELQYEMIYEKEDYELEIERNMIMEAPFAYR